MIILILLISTRTKLLGIYYKWYNNYDVCADNHTNKVSISFQVEDNSWQDWDCCPKTKI